MIIRPSTPGGSVVFCEDIRQEVDGKKTFVGVIHGDMLVNGAFPTLLPKMSFSIRYIERPNESTESVKLTVSIPPLAEGESDGNILEMEIIPTGKRPAIPHNDNDNIEMFLQAQLDFSIAPLIVNRPGHIMVRAWRGNDEIRLGGLKVLGNPQQVELQPSS